MFLRCGIVIPLPNSKVGDLPFSTVAQRTQYRMCLLHPHPEDVIRGPFTMDLKDSVPEKYNYESWLHIKCKVSCFFAFCSSHFVHLLGGTSKTLSIAAAPQLRKFCKKKNVITEVLW
jgi:hypothetical protein